MLESLLARLRGGLNRVHRDEAIEALTKAVRELADAQQKQAAQLKKLLEAQKAQDRRWEEALERWRSEARDWSRGDHQEAIRAGERLQLRWDEAFDSLRDKLKTEQKWRVVFAGQVNAVLRSLHLSRLPLSPPHDIVARRFRLWSQHEEDGIIVGLLEHAGVTNCRFIEIGSGRTGGNAAFLAYECGWSGLMIDIVPEAIENLRARFAHNPGVVGVAAEVSADNIDRLLSEHGFTGEVDLLSIDIDSYEYWVLEAITVVSPRVLVVEYHAGFGPERAVTIPRDVALDDIPKTYRGASLAALEKLARRKGYRLVVCDPSGTNAFFLRDDVAPKVPGVSVVTAYRPATDRLEMHDVPDSGRGVVAEDGPLVEV
jgi:methyltransferase FkbM-like protein